MSKQFAFGLTTVAALGLSASSILAAEPSTQELLEQIKQLQAKVEQLEVKQSQTSEDVAVTVQKVFEDAQKRSQLMTSNGNFLAGYENNRFFLKSADNNYLLSPSLEFQFRNTTNYDTADDSLENGFEVRRMKLRLDGNAITPKLTYAFQWATSSTSGTPTLEDAWVRYEMTPGWFLRGGQFKDPLVHEQLVSGRRQLAADRSMMTLILTGSSDNYVQGVALTYDAAKQPLRVDVGFTDGVGSQNTNWQDPPVNNNDFGVVGRVEYYVTGERRDYDQFTALNDKSDLLVFGAAMDATQAGSQTTYLQTADAQWDNSRGLSAYGAFLASFIDGATEQQYNWGLEVQGAYLFKPKWEAFARYDFTKFQDDVTFTDGGAEDFFQEFTIGMNYYVKGHNAKFTVDTSYLPNGCPNNQTGLGYVAGDEAQFALRAQFQLVL